MNNYLARFFIDQKTKELMELKRRLAILNQGRKDHKGGDCFIPDHMVYLTD